MEKYLSQKDEVIKKLSKEIEDAKKNMSVDQVSYTSEGISEK